MSKNKISLLLVLAVLSGCSNTPIHEVSLQTNQMTGEEYRKLEERINNELTREESRLYHSYQNRMKRSGESSDNISIGQAIAKQRVYETQRDKKDNQARNTRLQQQKQQFEQQLTVFKREFKKQGVLFKYVDEGALNELVSREIQISRPTLVNTDFNEIKYLSKDNPWKYRYDFDYEFSIDNKNTYGVQAIDYTITLPIGYKGKVEAKRRAYISKDHSKIKQRLSPQVKQHLTQLELKKLAPSIQISQLYIANKPVSPRTFYYYQELLDYRYQELMKIKAATDQELTSNTLQKYRWKKLFNFSPVKSSDEKRYLKETYDIEL